MQVQILPQPAFLKGLVASTEEQRLCEIVKTEKVIYFLISVKDKQLNS